MCLAHASHLCECKPEEWTLAWLLSLAQLEELLAAVQGRIPPGAANVLSGCKLSACRLPACM